MFKCLGEPLLCPFLHWGECQDPLLSKIDVVRPVSVLYPSQQTHANTREHTFFFTFIKKFFHIEPLGPDIWYPLPFR